MTIAQIVKKYVKEKKQINPRLSQSSIAKKAKVSQSALNKIINEQAVPSNETIEKLSKFIPELKRFLPLAKKLKDMLSEMKAESSSEIVFTNSKK